MSQNGKLPANELAPIPGGRLRRDAAAAWLALRSHIGNERGVWICPTSPRTAYRPLADQQYFWNLYKSGRGALAAVPGTSNHGWGIAVDLPTPAMQAAMRAHGHRFGWGIRGGKLSSDAPSEPWHSTYHPGVFKPPPAKKHVHPYHLLTDRERAARDALVMERRIAKRHGGWERLDHSHHFRAVQAKATLVRCAAIIAAAAKESGWRKFSRKTRYDYINKLIRGAADDEAIQHFPPPDAGEPLADEPDPAFGETSDDGSESALPDEPDTVLGGSHDGGSESALPDEYDPDAEWHLPDETDPAVEPHVADEPDPASGETVDDESEPLLPGKPPQGDEPDRGPLPPIAP